MHLHIISRADAKRAGLKYYFTGKACKHGHVALRRADSSDCQPCTVLRAEKTFSKNKEAIREYKKKWSEQNKSEIREKRKKYREARKKQISASKSDYYKKNREKILKKYRESYHENHEVAKARAVAWRINNPEKARILSANKKARRKGAEGHHTKDDIQRILKDQKHKCANCLCDVSGGYHVDHIMPLKLGGANWPDNLQILCPTCNLRKNAKHPIDWAQENGRLL